MANSCFSVNRNFFTIVSGMLLAVSLLLMTGCGAVHDTALKPGDTLLTLQHESIVLMSIKTTNKYKPGYPPEVYRISVTSDDENKTEYKTTLVDMGVGSLVGKALKDVSNLNKGDSWEDFVTLRLPPGSYRLTEIVGGSINGLITGGFEFPFDNPFTLGAGTIVYVGRIEMVNRKRTSEDEVPSGGEFPIVDQAATGFGDGTFDVTMIDNFDQDMVKFIEKYPALSGQEIIKQILAPWKKPLIANK